MPAELAQAKRPVFATSSGFDFSAFPAAPDFALAQSLFTHLTLRDILRCLKALRARVAGPCRFFATFFEEGVTPRWPSLEGVPNPPWSHSNLAFFYSQAEVRRCALRAGWGFRYIGDWSHPRAQQMLEFHI